MRTLSAVLVAASFSLALSGCPKKAAEPTPPTGSTGGAAATAAAPSEAAKAEAKTIFDTRCMPCHGAGGAGDGPASAGLTPKPRNFTDKSWQTSVTDDHLEKIVQFGGAAVGKSPAMPPNPDLVSKPEVITALRLFVRGLGK